MSGRKSPFTRVMDSDRSEMSPLLSEGSDNSRRSPVLKKKPARHKQSFPLVYTEFRSPDPVRHDPQHVDKDNQEFDVPGKSEDTAHVSKHSHKTNLETLNSSMIWLLLLLPITMGCIAYASTIHWRYHTHQISAFEANSSDARQYKYEYVFPSSPTRTEFIRPVLAMDSLKCSGKGCSDYNIHIEGLLQDTSLVPTSMEYEVLGFNVSISNFVRRYMARKVNDIVFTDKRIIIPLPMVYLGYPLLTRRISQQKLAFLMSLPQLADNDSHNSEKSFAVESVAMMTDERGIGAENLNKEMIFLNMLAYSESYTLCVTIVQFTLSILTVILLIQFTREVYRNAFKLHKRFVCLHGVTSSREAYYGAIDSIEIVDADGYCVKWWHFVLPEQFTSAFLLFFLCVWQSALSSLCGLLHDAAQANLSDNWLFAAGLTVSLAQFGMLFCCTVYIDGLKYHNSEASSVASIRTRIEGGSMKSSRHNSRRKEYNPFEVEPITHTIGPDECDPDYWRRGSLGLRGYTSNRSNGTSQFLTPLEKEYRKAMSVYLTYHHPSSREFLGFIYGKLVFLVISWIVVVVYWLLMYPRIWHDQVLTSIQITNIQNRVWWIEIVVEAITVLWIYLLVQACFLTAARLRRAKLIDTRFRQLIFRTLTFQTELGIAVLILIGSWYIYNEKFFENITFSSMESVFTYIFMWLEHYGVLHMNSLLNPPLSVHNIEVLMFTSVLTYCIAYCMLPPDHDGVISAPKRVVQSFVALERLLPISSTNLGETDGANLGMNANLDSTETETARGILLGSLKQFLVEEDYRRFMGTYLPRVLKSSPSSHFCLETALVYLEVSYQTYFSSNAKLLVTSNSASIPGQYSYGHTNMTEANDNVNMAATNKEKKKKTINPFDEEVTAFPTVSKNPFDEEEEDDLLSDNKINVLDTIESQANPTPPLPEYSGPQMNLTGLGYTLKKTFSCEKYTTFGFLCEMESTGKLIVSFRGSLLGNAVMNLKFTQISLPQIKRPRSFFTTMIRLFSASDPSPQVSESKSDLPLTPMSELILDNDLPKSVNCNNINDSRFDEFAELCDGVVSADEDEEDINYHPPNALPSTSIKDTNLARGLRNVGSAIPLVNQGFKRVHAGFWESYSSIREEFLGAIVRAMYERRKAIIESAHASAAASPGGSWYNAHAGENNKSTSSTVSATINGIRSLFTSPMGAKNPFSPLFSPPTSKCNEPSPHHTTGIQNSAHKEERLEQEVIFCGHSLGAAIASLAAFELAENLPAILEAFAMEECFNVPKTQGVNKLPAVLACPAPKISLYMFGSPRVGNTLFSQSISRKINTIFRIQVNGDVVTMMPKFVGFYRHFGTAVIVDEEESGSVIIEPTIIERSILQKSTGSVANHSLDKYRACLEACFEPAELEEYLTKEFKGLTAGRGSHQDLPDWMVAQNLV